MKHTFIYILLTLILVLPSVGVLADDTPALQLQIGDRREYTSPAEVVFAADEAIVSVKKLGPTSISIVGITAGTTQVIFSNNGVFNYLSVTVSSAPTPYSRYLTPQFNSRYPYILYTFGDNFTFDDKLFYRSPLYTQSLTLYAPVGRGNLIGLTSFQFGDAIPKSFTAGNLTLNYGRFIWQLGNADAMIATQQLAPIAGIPAYGGSLKIRNLFVRSNAVSESLSLFGGIQPQVRLEDLRDTQRKFGFDYQVSKTRYQSLFKDFLNIGFAAYQPPGEHKYHFTGSFEEAWHVTRHIQLGSGVYANNGGYSLLVSPIWDSLSTIIRPIYRFVRHGLEIPGGITYGHNEHSYQVNFQKLFRDKITNLSAGLTHTFSFSKEPASTTPSSNVISAGFTFNRQYTIAKRKSITYGFGRNVAQGITSYSNNVTGVLAHPVTRTSYLQHSLNLNQVNATSSTTRQGKWSELFQQENLRVRNRIMWDLTVSRTNRTQIGTTLGLNSELFIKSASIQLAALYSKNDVDDNTHQFQFTNSILMYPTSTYLFSLNNTMSVVRSLATTMNGAFTINFQHYMGPGVERDSLVKKLLSGIGHEKVGGRVFLDVNYNGYFEEGDIPLVNTQIVLDGKMKTFTGPQGVFLFSGVKAGSHTITVPADPLQGINTPQTQTITVAAGGAKNIPIAVVQQKAILTVRARIDANENKAEDDEDPPVDSLKVSVEDKDGKRRAALIREGGTIFQGVEMGDVTVTIDPASIRENLTNIGPLTQHITISEYKEYTVTFLFDATRSLRGQVKAVDGAKLPPRIGVKIGSDVRYIDKDGYYWFKDLKEGTYQLELVGLPAGLCPKGGELPTIQVISPHSGVTNILITDQCTPPATTPPAPPAAPPSDASPAPPGPKPGEGAQ